MLKSPRQGDLWITYILYRQANFSFKSLRYTDIIHALYTEFPLFRYLNIKSNNPSVFL